MGRPFNSHTDDEIAAKVIAAAKDQEYGVYDNKVFISDLYDSLKREYPDLTEQAFKAKLLELNNQGKVNLSRVDMVQYFHPDDVRRSETNYPSGVATFHTVRLDPKTGGVRNRKNRKDETTGGK